MFVRLQQLSSAVSEPHPAHTHTLRRAAHPTRLRRVSALRIRALACISAAPVRVSPDVRDPATPCCHMPPIMSMRQAVTDSVSPFGAYLLSPRPLGDDRDPQAPIGARHGAPGTAPRSIGPPSPVHAHWFLPPRKAYAFRARFARSLRHIWEPMP